MNNKWRWRVWTAAAYGADSQLNSAG